MVAAKQEQSHVGEGQSAGLSLVGREAIPFPEQETGNSFVTFLREHEGSVVGFITVDADLKACEDMKKTDEVEANIKQLIDLSIPTHFPNGYSRRQYDKYYSDHHPRLVNLYFSPGVLSAASSRVGVKDHAVWSARTLKTEDSDQYIDAHNALSKSGQAYVSEKREKSETLRVAKHEVFESLRTYFLSSSGERPLTDFAAFLQDEAYEPTRQAIRGFLGAFAAEELKARDHRNPTLLDTARDAGMARMKVNMAPEVLDEFAVLAIKSAKIMQVMQFAIAAAGMHFSNPEDPSDDEIKSHVATVLKKIPYFDVWPDDLKVAYSGYAEARCKQLVAQIHDGLRPFQRTEAKVRPEREIAVFDGEKKKREKEGEAAQSQDQGEVFGHSFQTLEEATAETFSPELNQALDKMRIEEEIDWDNLPCRVVTTKPHEVRGHEVVYEDLDPRTIIYKVAAKYPSLKADFEKMMMAMLKDPMGVESIVLNNRWLRASNQRKLQAREFKLKNGSGSLLEHDESYRFRILYAFDSSCEAPTVILHGLYHHNKMDQLLRSGKLG